MLNIKRLMLVGSIALFGLALIYQVPYLFPPAVRTISASYDYGFNNTVGILIIIAFSIVFLGLGFVWTSKEKISRFPDLRAEKAGLGEISRRDISVLASISLILIAFLYLLSGDIGFGESQQFLFAMDRISLGQALYTDFDFYYGPLLAYGPYAIYKLGSLLSISQKTAYFISLAVFQMISLLQLRYILNSIVLRQGISRKMFYAIALSTLPFHSGINLILFRFITPVAGFIFLKKMENSGLTLRAALIVALSFLTFGISVEYGVVFSVALLCYYLASFVIDKQTTSLFGLILTLASPGLFYQLFPGLFNTVHLYLLGAWRWPFVPSLVLTLFFVAIFVVAFFMGALLRNIKDNYFFLSLCFLAIGSLPAALGRCDPGHVVLNGLMIFIFSYIYISETWNRKLTTSIGFLFILQFSILYNYATIKGYSTIYMTLGFKKFNQAIPQQEMANLIEIGSRISGMSSDVVTKKIQKFNESKLLDYNHIFGNINKIYSPYALPEDILKYLRTSNKIAPLYFKDFSILASDPEVNFAIEDMKKKNPEFLILPDTWEALATREDYSTTINEVFSTKYTRIARKNSRLLLIPFIDYVKSNYTVHDKFGKFLIMKKLTVQ